MRRWVRVSSRVVLIGVLFGAACSGGSTGPVGVPDLSENLDAQRDIQRMRAIWERGDADARRGLEPALARHVKVHKEDPTARVAKAMLAFLALDRQELERASGLAQPIVLGDVGTTRDMAWVVLGSVARRRGKAATALKMLEPLFNKVIDPVARDTLNEELTLAALESEKFDPAVRYLRAWMRQSVRSGNAVAPHDVARLFTRFPAKNLLALLVQENEAEKPDAELSRAIARHLAVAAIEAQDVALARSLIDVAGPLLGDMADPVARVAVRGSTVRLERNTVGLLLPLRTEQTKRRGIEVAIGLALALEVPGSKARIVSRDDQRDVSTTDESLALLNSDGAAVIVAGYDVKEADLALGYAERTGVPMILLRPPSRPVPKDGHVFVLGEDPFAVRDALATALAARGALEVALLVSERGDGAVPAPKEGRGIVAVQPCGATLDFVRTAGATGLIVDGGPACAADALGRREGRLALAFGLDTSSPGAPGVHAACGIFPDPSKSADPLLAKFRETERVEPSWWVALGHDAGLLVKAAVAELPQQDADDAAAHAQRKELVARAVARAQVDLWTTEARGFAGGRVIPRTIKTEDRAAGSAANRPLPKGPGRTAPTR
jgi:hypothetical protein